MLNDWQNIATLICVLMAAGYVGRQLWHTFALRKSGRCGSCGSCPANKTAGPQVLSLESLRTSSKAIE